MFHNRCVRGILGVSRHQQWRDHISTEQLAVQFGMCDGIGVLLVQRRLRWLGHVARIGDNWLPKQLLFGELRLLDHLMDQVALQRCSFEGYSKVGIGCT